MKCPECAASGIIWTGKRWIDCWRCSGSGVIGSLYRETANDGAYADDLAMEQKVRVWLDK